MLEKHVFLLFRLHLLVMWKMVRKTEGVNLKFVKDPWLSGFLKSKYFLISPLLFLYINIGIYLSIYLMVLHQ